MNDNVKKQHSSFMFPKIITIANFTNVKYLEGQCYKRLLDVSFNHSQATRLHTNRCSKATWLFYMVIWKREAKRSNLFSSRRMEFSLDWSLDQSISQNKFEPLARPNAFEICALHEDSINIVAK